MWTSVAFHVCKESLSAQPVTLSPYMWSVRAVIVNIIPQSLAQYLTVLRMLSAWLPTHVIIIADNTGNPPAPEEGQQMNVTELVNEGKQMHIL